MWGGLNFNYLLFVQKKTIFVVFKKKNLGSLVARMANRFFSSWVFWFTQQKSIFLKHY